MKIKKIGYFNEKGFPAGWDVDGEDTPEYKQHKDTVLYISPEGRVFIRGVEIVELNKSCGKAVRR